MPRFTEVEVVEVWKRRQAGESNRSIGRRLVVGWDGRQGRFGRLSSPRVGCLRWFGIVPLAICR